MKIDLDWIQKELDAGRDVELECVDEPGFVAHDNYSSSSTNKQILCDADLRVVNIRLKTIYFNCGRSIIESMLKYFRIKHSTPTFDDLIDVLIKAKKDNIVSRVEINRNSLNATVNLTDSKIVEFCISKDAGGIVFKERIDWINSLYTETFVIESEDHIGMVKLKASVRLTNGNEFIVDNATSEFLTSSTSFEKLTILTLKGATVTQRKGNK